MTEVEQCRRACEEWKRILDGAISKQEHMWMEQESHIKTFYEIWYRSCDRLREAERAEQEIDSVTEANQI